MVRDKDKDKENMISLKNWILTHNINKDESAYENLFYRLDLNMKNLHENGYYITSFNVNDIFISSTLIKYKDIKKLYYQDRDFPIHKNIFYLSCMALGVYNDCLDYINPENPNYLKSNFSSFSQFIPESSVPYYRGIIERNAKVYYSDYIKAKIKRENQGVINGLNNENNGNSSTNNFQTSNSKSLSKSTFIGSLYSDDNDKAAFIHIILFPLIILLSAILIPLMIIIST